MEGPNCFQAVGQWPSKRDPAEVWLKVLQGALFGRNYPGIAAFWNERRNRCRDATHPAGPKVMHRAMGKQGSPRT